jgi:hypothetical protein
MVTKLAIDVKIATNLTLGRRTVGPEHTDEYFDAIIDSHKFRSFIRPTYGRLRGHKTHLTAQHLTLCGMKLMGHLMTKISHNSCHPRLTSKCKQMQLHGEVKRDRRRNRMALKAFAVKLFLSLRRRAYRRRFVCWCGRLHKAHRLRDAFSFSSEQD